MSQIPKPFKNQPLADLPTVTDATHQLVSDPATGKPAKQAIAVSSIDFANENISTLPTSDPGSGKPYRVKAGSSSDGYVVGVGAVTNNRVITTNELFQNVDHNPTDPNYKPAVKWDQWDSYLSSNAGFTTHALHGMVQFVSAGLNFGGEHGYIKNTFITQTVHQTSWGSGQRIMQSCGQTSYGTGDLIGIDRTITYYGGLSAGGDEGTKFERYAMVQAGLLQKDTIAEVIQNSSVANTTTTQPITASKNNQTITLASGAGITVGMWLGIGIGSPGSSEYQSAEAVKVIAVSGNTITARFNCNHVTNAVVRGCTVLRHNSGNFGQGRMLVNLSSASYSTGTARGVANTNGLLGSGTSWSVGMVGGDAINPGVIALDADDVTQSPFNSTNNRLKAWYPIASVANAESLNVFRRDQVGIAIYKGKGTTLGGYTVRAGARILTRDAENDWSARIIVLEPNSFTWTVGDSIECAHSTSADVSGATWDFQHFTPGATLRDGLNIRNSGTETFDSGITVSRYGSSPGGWKTGISLASFEVGVGIDCPGTAIAISTNLGAMPGTIAWVGTGCEIEYNSSNRGFRLQTTDGGFGGALDFISTAVSGKSHAIAEYTGAVRLKQRQAGLNEQAYLEIEGYTTDNTWRVTADNSGLYLRNYYLNALYGTIAFDATGILLGTYFAQTATSGANKASNRLNWSCSIWNGTAAESKQWFSEVAPVSNSTNAIQEFRVRRPTSNSAFPATVISTDSNGKLGFGHTGTGGVETDAYVYIDPVNITGTKTLTLLNSSGGIPVIVAAPATATSTGVAGQIAYDGSYFYICTATNTWLRSALSTW